MKLFTTAQIHMESLKQWNWLHNNPKQKEFIELETQFCDPLIRGRHFHFMGFSAPMPQLFHMSFHLTNDHLERDVDHKMKEAEFDFNLPLN